MMKNEANKLKRMKKRFNALLNRNQSNLDKSMTHTLGKFFNKMPLELIFQIEKKLFPREIDEIFKIIIIDSM